MVHAVIREGDAAEEQGVQRKGRKNLGLASGHKKRKLTTREQLVHAQELQDKKKDLTLYNLRALVPAEAYTKVAPSMKVKRSKEEEAEDEFYAAEASSAAAAAAKLEKTYEDATLGEYMKGITRLRGETREQIRRKRARIAEAELAASVDAISREDVPVELLQRASAQNPVDFDEFDDDEMTAIKKKKKKTKSQIAAKKMKRKSNQKTQKAAAKREMEEAKLAMSVPAIARAANKLRKKKQ